MGWGDFCPYMCNHCDTLFHDGEMALAQVRFEVIQTLRAHAAKLNQAANNASRCVRALEEQKKPGA